MDREEKWSKSPAGVSCEFGLKVLQARVSEVFQLERLKNDDRRLNQLTYGLATIATLTSMLNTLQKPPEDPEVLLELKEEMATAIVSTIQLAELLEIRISEAMLQKIQGWESE